MVSMASVLAVVSISQGNKSTFSGSIHSPWMASVGSVRSFGHKDSARYKKMEYRIAKRLRERLRKTRGSPPLTKLAKAIKVRQSLLKKKTAVIFSTEEDQNYHKWDVSVSAYPTWIVPEFSLSDAKFELSSKRVQDFLDENEVVEYIKPTDVKLVGIRKDSYDEGLLRGVTDEIAKPGYVLDKEDLGDRTIDALMDDEDEVIIELEKTAGKIINKSGLKLGKLKLLASGRSDYTGSTYARKKNVQKALGNHVHNTMVKPGEEFSFNETLGGRVTLSNGWKMAKVILNGDELVDQPGGGICQASTTTFRAIVNGGFPVIERRSHSLYVSYYTKHGVGIDATIYPGTQDLVFLNDTEDYLLIQAYNEGTEAYVNIYGSPDGRKVELEGPYFAHTAPDDVTYNGRDISTKEILWFQHVKYKNGEEREYPILSRYQTLPEYVRTQFAYKEED